MFKLTIASTKVHYPMTPKLIFNINQVWSSKYTHTHGDLEGSHKTYIARLPYFHTDKKVTLYFMHLWLNTEQQS